MSDTQEKKEMRGLINVSADLGKAADVANNLLDKLAAAVGWFATRETPKRIGLQCYIAELQKSDLPPLEKAARITNAQKELKEYIAAKPALPTASPLQLSQADLAAIRDSDLPEPLKAVCASALGQQQQAYCNQEVIVAEAISNLHEDARPEEVSGDWLFQFMDKARLVSDEEMQLIWGRILAGECNAPGSVPKSLLHILEQMEKEQAETFTALRSLSVHRNNEEGKKFFYPFYFECSNPSIFPLEYFLLLHKKSLSPDAVRELISLGLLVKAEQKVSFLSPIHYYEESFCFDGVKALILLPTGDLAYTKAGQALCRSILVPKEKGFFEEICVLFWRKEIEKQEREAELNEADVKRLLEGISKLNAESSGGE